jgi:thiamine biosynthesis lipoprotein
VTVQALWRLFASHFSRPDADLAGPARRDIASAVDLVGDSHIEASAKRVVLARSGMAITLNGVAQGLITDRIADMLRAGGIADVLVDLDETRAMGRHPSGRPWSVGIVDPSDRRRIATTAALQDRALATSGGYGVAFDPARRHHHLFDARTGASAEHYLDVAVGAPDALTANALSTALIVSAPARAQACLDGFASVSARMIRADGSIVLMSSAQGGIDPSQPARQRVKRPGQEMGRSDG